MTPSARPIEAKIRPTSPRGIMPRPTSSRSELTPLAPTPATTLPTTATAMSAAAMPMTDARPNCATSVWMPISRKNTGMNRWPTGVSSRWMCDAGRLRPSARPATNAPMIGASLASVASSATASAKASARAKSVADDRANRSMAANSRGATAMPTAVQTTRKATASPMMPPTAITSSEPSPVMSRTTTVRMTRPSTSSATAAPSTVLASMVASARRSPKTRAVMPTLVAVSAAATKRASSDPSPKPTATG